MATKKQLEDKVAQLQAKICELKGEEYDPCPEELLARYAEARARSVELESELRKNDAAVSEIMAEIRQWSAT